MGSDFDIQSLIDDMLRQEFVAEWNKAIDEELRIPDRWQGFSGLRPIFDDPDLIWPRVFTPEQFNRLWDGWSKEMQIRYVIRLIT